MKNRLQVGTKSSIVGYWAILLFALACLVQINVALVSLLVALSRMASDFGNVFPFAVSELFKLVLSGWLFFTRLYVEGKGLGWLKREDLPIGLFSGILLDFFGVNALNLVASSAPMLISGRAVIDWRLLVAILALGVAWSIYRLFPVFRRRWDHRSRVEKLPDLSDAGRALKRIKSRLTTEEQSELASLAFESGELSKSNIWTLLRIVMTGVVIAFFISLLQELLGRLSQQGMGK